MGMFTILKDFVTELPAALSKITQGLLIDPLMNGLLAFVFKNSDGEAAMPQMNPDGSISVSFDAGISINNAQILAAGAQTKDVEIEVLVIDLVVGKIYNRPNAHCSNFRSSLFRLVYVDDYGVTDTEKEIGYGLTDAGDYNEDIGDQNDEFSTVGGTGAQKLVVYHTPLDKESDAYVSLTVNEVP